MSASAKALAAAGAALPADLVERLALFGRGLAIDAFGLDLAIVDFPRLVGEIIADIAAFLANLCPQRAYLGHQLLHLAGSGWRQGRTGVLRGLRLRLRLRGGMRSRVRWRRRLLLLLRLRLRLRLWDARTVPCGWGRMRRCRTVWLRFGNR